MNLFDWKTDADAAAAEAIERVGANADADWKRQARQAIRAVLLTHDEFTTDDVWDLLDRENVKTHDRRAMGAIIREFSRNGAIAATGTYVKSSRVECHSRPVAVWTAR